MNFEIGGRTAAGQEFTNRIFNGKLSEVVVYQTALSGMPFRLVADQAQRIESYLAVKYGITLTTDYLASDGSKVWDKTANSTDHNDVTGIARDDKSELHQPKSKSINTGSILTVYHDANGGMLQNDKSFYIRGHNGGDTSFDVVYDCDMHMNRVWKVSDNNNFGALTFMIPDTFDADYMLVDTDGDGNFSTGTVNEISLVSDGMGSLTAKADVADGQCFTFSMVLPCPPSGGDVTTTNHGEDKNRNVITWSDESDDEVEFVIDWGTTPGGPYPNQIVVESEDTGGTGGGMGYNHAGLACGTTYYYQISSQNADDQSTPIGEYSVTTAARGAIPTVSEYGLILLAVLISLASVLMAVRRSRSVS